MGVEERVQVVEKDVRNLHQYAQKTHAERQGWYNEFRDARAEVRGWAEFAVKANNKVEVLAKFCTVVEGAVNEANGKLTSIEGRLDGVDATLKEHGDKLNEHSEKLAEHDRRFDQIDTTLADHGDRLDRIQEGLRQQSSMLRQLLEKAR